MQEIQIHDKVFRVMIEAERIQSRINFLASQINADYKGRKPLFLGVLNGAFLFAAGLFKGINIECEISFIRVKSYSGTGSSGQIKNLIGLSENLQGRHIIVIEDIVDTGDTARYLVDEIQKQHPASLKFATMLYKPKALKKPFIPDYIGFEIDPEFVVGYGLDYDELGRNLNDIYVLKK